MGGTILYQVILKLLKDTPEGLTTTDIQQRLATPYSTTARAMGVLSRQKRVRKLPSRGHGYIYKFKTFDLPVGQRNLPTPNLYGSDGVYKELSTTDLQAVVSQWLSSGWKPKSIDAAHQLVDILSTFYQLSWLEVTRGTPVDQSDIDHLKTRLIEAKRLADSFAEFFGRLLATDELWSSKSATSYLVREIDDPQEFLESARKVNQVLQ